MRSRFRAIPKDQLSQGFSDCVDNAIELLSSAMSLERQYPAKALALAQVGQEELGKAFLIVSAYGLSTSASSWEWFWAGWRNHTLKAHRAYLFELVSPLRIAITGDQGRVHDGLPLRNPISREKEVGLYVDFDRGTRRFTSPSKSVSSFECWARMSTLMYLSGTADAVNRALCHCEKEFRFDAFGSLALRLCTEEIYQQDMPNVLLEFTRKSESHARLIADLEAALEGPKDLFTAMAAAIDAKLQQ